MQDKAYGVKFYTNGNGRSPVVDFISKKMNTEEKATLMRLIEQHQELGVQLIFPHTRQVSGKVHELRLRRNKRAFRIFFFINEDQEIVYLHAIVKASTPLTKSDIKTAVRRMNEVAK